MGFVRTLCLRGEPFTPMTYSDKLRDPRWQRKRLEIMQRDGFACRDCGDDSATLHVHHCLYRKDAEPWENDASELRTLCAKCHEERPWVEKDAVERFKKLMAKMDQEAIQNLRFEIKEIADDVDSKDICVTAIESNFLEYLSDIRWWNYAIDNPEFRPAYEAITKKSPNWEEIDKATEANENQNH